MSTPSRIAPTSSAAISGLARPAELPTRRIPVTLRREGLGYAPLSAPVCPHCQVAAPEGLETLLLRRHPAWLKVSEKLGAPPAVFLSALGLMAVPHLRHFGVLLFFFGPCMSLSHHGVMRLVKGSRLRVKLGLCAACRKQLRELGTREARFRRLKNVAAWALVLVAPVAMGLTAAASGWDLAAGALAATCLVGWAAERSVERARARRLPELESVDETGARILVPAHWPRPAESGAG
ncbi:MAG: hypothetical protein AB2A00_38345 [Myxococcota bacterium]